MHNRGMSLTTEYPDCLYVTSIIVFKLCVLIEYYSLLIISSGSKTCFMTISHLSDSLMAILYIRIIMKYGLCLYFQEWKRKSRENKFVNKLNSSHDHDHDHDMTIECTYTFFPWHVPFKGEVPIRWAHICKACNPIKLQKQPSLSQKAMKQWNVILFMYPHWGKEFLMPDQATFNDLPFQYYIERNGRYHFVFLKFRISEEDLS